MEPSAYFRRSYCGLTGNPEPFPWQEALFLQLCQAITPDDVALPTGCGKTSVMAAWLAALAYQAGEGAKAVALPRRLVWVVNRRVVVDQATSEASTMQGRLNDPAIGDLEGVRLGLRMLCLDRADGLLGVSTLRGQFADNAEWRDHPSRAAVIVGTVDMIGSRLLFSGYGRGFKSRPLHAGFLGQDALLVHDEAHLEPAFQSLIEAVQKEQERRREFRPLRVMALTATSRRADRPRLGLTAADREHPEIRRRIQAGKGIRFHPVDSEKKVRDEAVRLALEFKESGQAILVFLRKVDDVIDVASRLRKSGCQAGELTGTIRGHERDRMAAEDGVFARFSLDRAAQSAAPAAGTVYFVCTSAGEVGVNMSADHLVCDLTPFDSITQRFGRVNRLGRGDAQIEMVAWMPSEDKMSETDRRRERTLGLLYTLPVRADGRHDASPLALESLPLAERVEAFSPAPEILAATGILFDAWAMTTVRDKMPGRPPVSDWLHGVTTWEPAETHVAWRSEVGLISEELQFDNPPEDLLEDYPLKPHELLRDTADRVSEQLEKIVERRPETVVWRVDAKGNVEVKRLSGLVLRDTARREAPELVDCIVLLPPAAGGLGPKGMLDGSAAFGEGISYDVADEWLDGNRRQKRRRSRDLEKPPAGMRLVRAIDLSPGGEDEPAVEGEPGARYWRWYVRERWADDDGSRTARGEQEWLKHTEMVEGIARELVGKLGLQEPEAGAIVLAAKWHDLGKRRDVWQRSIGNSRYPDRVLAKSDWDAVTFPCKYRHEFGSLVDVTFNAEFLALAAEAQEMVLHFIGAHHGRARPHFPAEEAFDPQGSAGLCADIGRETPRRFARLQSKYGRWGLAYLESLVRAADGLASQQYLPENEIGSELETAGGDRD